MAQKKQTRFENEEFGSETLLIDGLTFVNCTFNQTKLVFLGDANVSFTACKLNEARWEFSGSAARTIQMLRALYLLNDDGRHMVEGFFHQPNA